MSEQSNLEVIEDLQTEFESRFKGAVIPDERKGYDGFIVQTDKIVEFATVIRDEYGYDYLSSVTGVDYLPE